MPMFRKGPVVTEKFYMILNEKTQLYSRGGEFPVFHEIGKVWTKKSDILAHLRAFKGKLPKEWRILCIEPNRFFYPLTTASLFLKMKGKM